MSGETTSAPDQAVPASVRAWLEGWAGLVAAQQFAQAADLFDEQIYSFGTVLAEAVGRENLMAGQWQAVWPRTRGFRFITDSARSWGDDEHHTVAVRWTSEGIDAHSQQTFARSGRATLVLKRQGGRWTAVHSHFSIDPVAERFLPIRELGRAEQG